MAADTSSYYVRRYINDATKTYDVSREAELFREVQFNLKGNSNRSLWYRGSYLLERPQPDRVVDSEPTTDSAEEAWRTETGLQREDLWRTRLRAEGLDVGSFRSLLASIDKPEKPTEMGWLMLLQDISTAAANASPADLEEVQRYSSSFGFAEATWPFLLWARARYEQWGGAEDEEGVPLFATEALTESFLWSLVEDLTKLLLSTLTLELNVARLRGQLFGQTAEQRFQSFAEQRLTRAEDILQLLEEYPVLARLLVTRTRNWVDTTLQAMERFRVDRDLIRDSFGTGCDYLVEVSGGLSDLHRGGESVLAFIFRSGARLMYKPRSLTASDRFQDILRWANEQGVDSPFPTLTVLDRGHYGWEEFVEARECDSARQVRRFYRRQGGYLALLYALRSTDFHFENLIAVGEHPYLIDLETLFHHRVEDERAARATNKASRLISESVLGTGLLPDFMSDNDEEAASSSGLGGAGGQPTPVEMLNWKDVGTDNMRAVRAHNVLEEGSNRPSLEGQTASIGDNIEDFIAGFDNVYRMLEANKGSFGELLVRFRDDPVRHVLRPTFIYGLFIEGGHHPDFLRNGLDKDRLMDRLWISLRYASNAAKVVPSEREDLLNDDVPYFHTRPGSRHLWDSRNLCIRNFFETASLADVLDRCRALCDEDREFQKGLIRASLGMKGRRHPNPHPARVSTTRGCERYPNTFVDAAVEIANRLEETAIWGDDGTDVNWLSLEWVEEENKRQFAPTNVGLYSGVSGIAFFLAYLGKVCAQERYERTARAALRSAAYALEEDAPEPPGISAFTGRAAFVYTLMHASRLWDDQSLMQRALQEVKLLENEVSSDSSFDLLSGCAGTIVVLLNLHRLTGNRFPYQVAVSCGEHLLAHALDTPEGHAWKSPVAQKPLAGFSHGAAGIAWALFELARATGEARFRGMASSALRYERSLYYPQQGNWLDLRTARGERGESPLPIAWCNGAPGIGIMRLLCSDDLPDKFTEEEVSVALDTTLRSGFGRGQSLCHGDFGNLDLLLLAARRRRDPELLRMARSLGEQSLEEARERGSWMSGWKPGSDDEEPGLMIGTAGIGLGLLRLADDLKVPSPAYLAPPR